jgi:hypothetical protein
VWCGVVWCLGTSDEAQGGMYVRPYIVGSRGKEWRGRLIGARRWKEDKPGKGQRNTATHHSQRGHLLDSATAKVKSSTPFRLGRDSVPSPSLPGPTLQP